MEGSRKFELDLRDRYGLKILGLAEANTLITVDYAAGDIAHAMKKLNIQLENPEYKEVMWFPTSVSIVSYSFGATDVLLHLRCIVKVY
jgi:hypothetical protein